MMEPKKISFGFSKLKKPSLIQINKPVVKEEKNHVQYIDCLEGSSIKIIGGEEEQIKQPMIIPMKPNKKLLNLEEIIKNDFVVDENDVKPEDKKVENLEESSENLSLNELATRELLNEAKKENIEKPKIVEVPIPEKVVMEGEKESTLEDYENVPIQEYGLAMLRGMGWKEDLGIGKNQKIVKTVQPLMRPKGMGLGADKIAKQDGSVKPAVDKDGKVLTCCKGAYVKINAGLHKGNYGQIIGLDDESGRFIIKTALNNMNLSLNEFLVTPVTKEDYMKNSKVLNNDKYEEFLRRSENAAKIKSEEPPSDEETNKASNSNTRVKKERISRSDSEDENRYKRNIKQEKSDRSRENIKEERYIKKETSSSRYEKNKTNDYENSSEDNYRSRSDKGRGKYKEDSSEESYKRNERKHKSDDEEIKHKKKSKKSKKDKHKKHDSDSDSDDDHKRKVKKDKHKKKIRNRSDSDSDICKNKDDKRERVRERRHKNVHKNRDRERERYDKYRR